MESGSRKILVYRPAHLWLAIACAAVLLLVCAYALFDSGKHSAGTELGRLQQLRSELDGQIATQKQAIGALNEQIAVLQRSSEIDRLASLEVRNDFSSLQEELSAVRSELEFYRGIVSPGEVEPGLRIQRFHIEPTQKSGVYRYSLTLTQVKRNDKYVRGVVEIDVEGVEDGKTTLLPFSQLVEKGSTPMKYRFRYFQRFEGSVTIPDSFAPQRATVRLVPSGKNQLPGVNETMDWPA